ncbi:MAG: hypothetical protein GY851_26290 [bacterium]|nr:hypothetical protein [bacterium]
MALETGQTFNLPQVGFSITVPDGWMIRTNAEVMANRERFSEQLAENSQAPLFAATKYAESSSNINPTVQVLHRPVPQPGIEGARNALRLGLGGIAQMMGNVDEQSGPHPGLIGNREAVGGSLQYVIGFKDERPLKVESNMWCVPDDGFVYLIGLSGPADGPDESSVLFKEILASIAFSKKAL